MYVKIKSENNTKSVIWDSSGHQIKPVLETDCLVWFDTMQSVSFGSLLEMWNFKSQPESESVF